MATRSQKKAENDELLDDNPSPTIISIDDITQSQEQPRDHTSSPNCVKKAWSLLGLYLFTLDIITDCFAAYKFLQNGDIYWGWMTIVFTLLPILVTCIQDIHEQLSDNNGSLCEKVLLIIVAIFIAPFRLFGIVINSVNAIVRGQVDADTIRKVGHLKLAESMFEGLPQGTLQMIIIIVQGFQSNGATYGEPWQYVAVATSIISLAFTVSTNSYLFPDIPGKTKAGFFFIGILTVFSRLWVFVLYLVAGSGILNSFLLWLIPLITMLSVSIGIWLVKRFCRPHCCTWILPLAPDPHHRRDSWTTVAMTWTLTTVYNGFSCTGLFLSLANLILILGIVTIRSLSIGPSLWGTITCSTPPAISVIINLILVAIPYCRLNIVQHWLSCNDEGQTLLY